MNVPLLEVPTESKNSSGSSGSNVELIELAFLIIASQKLAKVYITPLKIELTFYLKELLL